MEGCSDPWVRESTCEEPNVWYYRRDVLKHCEAFQAVGYDLDNILCQSNP